MISPELDIIVPVYNEGDKIARLLDSFNKHVQTPFRILLCYDFDEDNTLPAAAAYQPHGFILKPVKNRGKGPLGAVITGFEESIAPAVLVCPADDDYNAKRIDSMIEKLRSGCDVVCASRFGNKMSVTGYPFSKAILVRGAGIVLHYIARLPTLDPTNGLRLFSGRAVRTIRIETRAGHAYSIELLVKIHRLGWRIDEEPAEWHERTQGRSRFRLLRWFPVYFRWFIYAIATTCLHRGPETVPRY